MKINNTETYHMEELDSLLWEMTIPLMMEDGMPARKLLKKDISFGAHLAELFSERDIDFSTYCEAGGGTGILSRDILRFFPGVRATLVDISPHLLLKQQKLLPKERTTFIQGSILHEKLFRQLPADLLICNEIASDLPTVVDSTHREMEKLFPEEYTLYRDAGILPHSEPFSLNKGALDLIKLSAQYSVKNLWMSEQSSEVSVSVENGTTINKKRDTRPQRIALKGHDEYTVAFSDLEKLAEFLGYKTERGIYSQIIPLKESLNTAFLLSHQFSDEREAASQFIHDLFSYEYLLLEKKA